MSTLLHSFETLGTRIASCSCPQGTPGRIHTLRLRRRFRHGDQPRSLAKEAVGAWDGSHGEPNDEISEHNLRRPQQLKQPPPPKPQSGEDHPHGLHPSESDTTSQSILSNASWTTANDERPSNTPIRKVGFTRVGGNIQYDLPDLSRGDTAGLRPLVRGHVFSAPSYREVLARALKTESPHAILNALNMFKTRVDGKPKEPFRSLPPNTFSEILRCLDPEYFVGRYVDLHRRNPGLHLPDFPLQTERGLQQFCATFMSRIKLIIEARRSSGYSLSLSDFRYLLRCAAVIRSPKASQTVWCEMKEDGFEPDTECYNYYLSGILAVGISNGGQRSELRTKYVPRARRQDPSEAYRKFYGKLGVDFKYETTIMFDDMLVRGVAGDERTFCLLMISSARVGDVEGVKSILDKVWSINADKIMTMNGKDIRIPKSYQMDSPFRPSETLLFTLAHCFGINNMVPTALRLIDYVSRIYSLVIPIEIWEDLLGITYALTRPGSPSTGKKRPDSLYLHPEAVITLWSVLTAQPFNVKPNMIMYDRAIGNLLRRQRFAEAQNLMKEAWELHKSNVDEYGATAAVVDFQTSLLKHEDDSEQLELMQATTAYENFLGLQRDKAFQNLALKHGREYLYRWCRRLLRLAPSSMLADSTFVYQGLPNFIYQYRLFMPALIEYPTRTGYVSFPSGSREMSKALAHEKAAQPWAHRKTNVIRGVTPSEQSRLEDDDDNDEFVLISDLDSDVELGESFGRS